MPDITMCQGTGCTVKESCYRFKANPSEWQSYFSIIPGKDASCPRYVEAISKSQVRRLDAQTEKK